MLLVSMKSIHKLHDCVLMQGERGGWQVAGCGEVPAPLLRLAARSTEAGVDVQAGRTPRVCEQPQFQQRRGHAAERQ